MNEKLKGGKKTVHPTAPSGSNTMRRTTILLALLLISVGFIGVASAAPRISSVTIGVQSPDPVNAGNNATYLITVYRSSTTGSTIANLAVDPSLPSGVTATFSPSTINLGTSGPSSGTSTLTLFTTSSTPAGLHPFTVNASRSGAPADYAVNTSNLNVTSTNTAPSVITQPVDLTITYGSDATFSAAASGTPAPTVQWQVSTNGGGTWSNIPAATSGTLTITNPPVSYTGYEYRANFTNPVGSVVSNAATLTVNKANATISVTPYDVTYDGNAHTATGTATGVKGESLSGLDLSGTTHTDAGTYTDTWTFTDVTGNYNNNTGTATDKISKADATITVTPYDVTYDGNAHTATGTATGVNDEALTGLDLSGTTHTDAGTYTDTWTFTNANYNDAGDSVTDKISKADATITVTPYDVTYDGNAHTATGTATGVNGEALTGLDLSGTTHTDAGTYTDTWTFTNANYNDAGDSVTDKISKADATITVTPYDVTYDGDEHTATGSATGVNDEALTGLDLSGTTHTDAGTYTDTWTFTDVTGNYNDAGDSVTDKISKADATITVTPYDVTYDMNAHTATGSATGVKDETLSGLDLSGTTHTGAGTYTDTWTFTDVTGNYNNDTGTVTDKIGQVDVTVTADDKTKQYSDNLPEFTANITGVLPGDSLDGTLSFECAATPSSPAGTYPIIPSGLTSDNYAIAFVNGTLTVTQENATCETCDDNPVAVRVTSDGGISDSFSLCVNVEETEPDLPADLAAPGDISLADVSMTLVPVGPGGPIPPTSSSSSVSGTGYDAVQKATFTFTGVPVNTYTVQVTIDGNYYVGSCEDVLVVYDPSLGFTTGGGWFFWPGTDDKTNFGFTMKYNKKGQNVQGSLLMIRHLDDGTIYRVKSNALDGLALSPTSSTTGWATFSGKSTYFAPGMLQPEGNHAFMVYAEDNTEPGTGVDKFWIQVTNGLSLSSPAADNAVNISGGNIVVPHSAKK
jgi:YbbR domain-containing protein